MQENKILYSSYFAFIIDGCKANIILLSSPQGNLHN